MPKKTKDKGPKFASPTSNEIRLLRISITIASMATDLRGAIGAIVASLPTEKRDAVKPQLSSFDQSFIELGDIVEEMTSSWETSLSE